MGHYRFSQWAISIVSALLIVLPQLKLTDNFDQGMSEILQSALAVVLLVYSILLSSENFYFRSKEFLRCGLEIDKIVGKIESLEITDYKIAEYEYRKILDSFENHETLDYERAWYSIEKWNLDNSDKFKRYRIASSIRLKTIFGYFYYIPFILLIILLLFFLKNASLENVTKSNAASESTSNSQ